MLVYVTSFIILLVTTVLAYCLFLRPEKKKPPSTTLLLSCGRSESSPVTTQHKLRRTSSPSDKFIPNYIPVHKASGNISTRSPEFKVPAPRFNKSRQTEQSLSVKDSSLNVTQPSSDTSTSSSSDTDYYSDEDKATYPRFKVVRRATVRPCSLSVTQTPSHFRPALENSIKLKKRKRRSSAARDKKRKRRLACESITSFKGAVITVKRRKGNNKKAAKLQKKRSLSEENGVSRRLKVKKVDASALYDHNLDVGCSLTLNPAEVRKLTASSRLVNVGPVRLREK